jgi:hypothetical protein
MTITTPAQSAFKALPRFFPQGVIGASPAMKVIPHKKKGMMYGSRLYSNSISIKGWLFKGN